MRVQRKKWLPIITKIVLNDDDIAISICGINYTSILNPTVIICRPDYMACCRCPHFLTNGIWHVNAVMDPPHILWPVGTVGIILQGRAIGTGINRAFEIEVIARVG